MRETLETILWLLALCAVTALVVFVIDTVIRITNRKRKHTIDDLRVRLKKERADKSIAQLHAAGLYAENITLRALNAGKDQEIAELKKIVKELQNGKPALHVRGKVSA